MSQAKRGILALSGPLVISFWFRSAFGWVDPIFASGLVDAAGNSIGDQSMAAIGLTLPFDFLMIACWVGTSNGLTSRLAAAMGAGNHARVEQLKVASRRITWALCALFLVIAAAVGSLAEHVGLDPVVASQFRLYAMILVGGSAFTSFWSILPDSLVKAHHDTRATMWAGLFSSVTNLILNGIFVFVFHWGILGIALSTVLGRLVGLAYAIHCAARHERERQALATATPQIEATPLAQPIRTILDIAVPSGMTYVLLAVESQIVNFFLARSEDAIALLAAWSIFDRAVRFLAMPMIAASVALLPLVARFFGSGDFASIRRQVSTALRAALVYVLVFVWPVSYWLGPKIAAFLARTEQTESAAQAALQWLPWAVLASVPILLFRAVFEGMQRPRPGLFVALMRSLFLVPPLVWFGLRWAEANEQSMALGAASGWVVGAALSSAAISLWLARALRPRRPAIAV